MSVITNFLKGIIIGIANIIPGVSGGTLALVLGIYEKLTEAIGYFFTNKEKRKEYFMFLAVVGAGAVAGILIFAKILELLLSSDTTAQPTYLFLIGLILGSIPLLFKIHKDMKFSVPRFLFFCLGLSTMLISLLSPEAQDIADLPQQSTEWFGILKITSLDFAQIPWLFLCGFISAGAMVIPGLSGSAVLISLGEYTNILGYINERMPVPLVVFGLGVASGILIIARIIAYLLKKHASPTYYFIMGLMAASVFQIFAEANDIFHFTALSIFLSALCLVLGFFTSYSSTMLKK